MTTSISDMPVGSRNLLAKACGHLPGCPNYTSNGLALTSKIDLRTADRLVTQGLLTLDSKYGVTFARPTAKALLLWIKQ